MKVRSKERIPLLGTERRRTLQEPSVPSNASERGRRRTKETSQRTFLKLSMHRRINDRLSRRSRLLRRNHVLHRPSVPGELVGLVEGVLGFGKGRDVGDDRGGVDFEGCEAFLCAVGYTKLNQSGSREKAKSDGEPRKQNVPGLLTLCKFLLPSAVK